MKLFSKLSIMAFVLTSSVLVGASGGGGHTHVKASYENLEDPDLNRKLVKLKFDIANQQASLEEATQMFKASFPDVIQGAVKINKLVFEDGNTALVVKESPIPIKILFKGQFLLDNKVLADKVGKSVKIKLASVDFVAEPIVKTLRVPFTDSPYWIHLTFSNYGKGDENDFIDNIKPSTIPY